MTLPKVRILIVDDEDDLRSAMAAYLTLAGFAVDGVGSGRAMDAWLDVHDCDIIVLDLGLPDEDGLDIARRLREPRSRGLIVSTARGAAADRLRGFAEGADHYLVKPVNLDELVAVARNLARRLSPPKVEAWRLDTKRWQLTNPDQRSVSLSRSEAVILQALAAQPGTAVPRDDLILRLGYNPLAYDTRRMEILVRRLRRKVEDAVSTPLPLSTVHALGYAFTAPIEVV